MNIKSLLMVFLSIIMLCFCGVTALSKEKADPVAEETVDCSEEALLALRDPFASQMPPKPVVAPDTSVKPVPTTDKNLKRPESGSSVPKQSGTHKPVDASSMSNQSLRNAPRLELTGIIFDTLKPKAIINGTVLGIGDRVEGYVLKSINKGVVEIQYDDKFIKLRMD